MGTIRVENLSKHYGSTTALDNIDFEIKDGEFVVLLGVSGAGKSTLLRLLNGLTQPSEGAIYMDGEEITGPRDDVAMVFQQHNLIVQMSAYENALTGSLNRTSFLPSVFRWHDREDKLEAIRALETVGLMDEAGKKVKSMSGGQQQRVGIARALVQDPTIMLADEPVASLDPASAETVMAYLRKVANQRNITSIASLHQVNIAREFGQRFLGLRDGKLIFDGYIDDLTIDVIDEIYGNVQTDAIRRGREEAEA
ncbi:phosphonate ABC transporter ATP-binding protein [Haloarchaeobius sp. TZWWS8]|uniref:phosphonate ABC transporter ATP-binding protein n=1 Tax=Haloarchaeobius sp. TZWWS8 TaxID=3446121 RepID=UPI003EB72FDE